MTSKNPSRVAFYARVSRTGQRELADLERTTLDEQRTWAQRYVGKGTEFVDDPAYYDLNYSGKNSRRPGLQRVLADVADGLLDGVAVGYLSRFGRNTRELLENVEFLHSHGATLYIGQNGLICGPGNDTTTMMLLTILAAVATMEADEKGARLKFNNERSVARGASTTIPFGYMRSDGKGSTLIFDERDDLGPAPADVVRRIFAMRLEGMGSTAIARALNAEGILTPSRYAQERGRRTKQISQTWTYNAIENMVGTYTYLGVIPRWQTEEVEGLRRPRRIPESLELLPGAHDALIDEETWRAAQFRRGTRPNYGSSGKAFLQSLLRCATCSRTMTPASTGKVYRCIAAECEHRVHVTRSQVDAYVEEAFLDILGNGGHGVAIVDAAELDKLDAELAQANEALRVFMAEADPTLLKGRLMPMYRRLAQAVDDLENDRVALVRARGRRPLPTPDVYRTRSVEQRRELLVEAFDAIVIAPAPCRGFKGGLDGRVHFVPTGCSPIELSGTGRPVPLQRFPVEDIGGVEAD